MTPALLLVDYVRWHYTRAFQDSLGIFLNFLWFITHFFSVPLLLRTLFSPWRRMTDDYDLKNGNIADVLVVNSLSRLLGFLVRMGIILVALCCYTLLAIMFISFCVGWILFPILPFTLIVFGFSRFIL